MAVGGDTSAYTSNPLNEITSRTTTTGGTTGTTYYAFDASGNLTGNQHVQAGQTTQGSTYSYDDLNRLTEVIGRDEVGALEHRTTFAYDAASRKRIAREYDRQDNAWHLLSEKRYVYDGMNVVQERDETNQVTATNLWAGNIGGLLNRRTFDATGQTHTLFYHYDGSGNVTQLTDATQNVVANYSYRAFGPKNASGSLAGLNPYRYSTKEFIPSVALIDYGYRFYSPGMSRWINRDPLGEMGGINLYNFVGNSPTAFVDEYGLSLTPWQTLGLGAAAFAIVATGGAPIVAMSFVVVAGVTWGYLNARQAGDCYQWNDAAGDIVSSAAAGALGSELGLAGAGAYGYLSLASNNVDPRARRAGAIFPNPNDAKTPEKLVWVEHGTTLSRAQSILKNGPNPNFVEPDGFPAGGFSTAPIAGPFPMGSPAEYAARKAALFPNEGGAAVVRLGIPESVTRKGDSWGGEIAFQPGRGLEDLQNSWHRVQKSIR